MQLRPSSVCAREYILRKPEVRPLPPLVPGRRTPSCGNPRSPRSTPRDTSLVLVPEEECLQNRSPKVRVTSVRTDTPTLCWDTIPRPFPTPEGLCTFLLFAPTPPVSRGLVPPHRKDLTEARPVRVPERPFSFQAFHSGSGPGLVWSPVPRTGCEKGYQTQRERTSYPTGSFL